MKIKRKKNDSEMVVFSFLPLMKGEVRWGLDSRTTPSPAPPFIREGNQHRKSSSGTKKGHFPNGKCP